MSRCVRVCVTAKKIVACEWQERRNAKRSKGGAARCDSTSTSDDDMSPEPHPTRTGNRRRKDSIKNPDAEAGKLKAEVEFLTQQVKFVLNEKATYEVANTQVRDTEQAVRGGVAQHMSSDLRFDRLALAGCHRNEEVTRLAQAQQGLARKSPPRTPSTADSLNTSSCAV